MRTASLRGFMWVLMLEASVAIVACGDDEDGPSGDGGVPSAGAGGEGGSSGAGSCEPSTCEASGVTCGTIDDGCGRVLTCGDDCGGAGAGGGGGQGCDEDAEVIATPARAARRARSAGFSGTIEQYTELYDAPCASVDDCSDACIERGGEQAMCEQSECLENSVGAKDCLPPPVWTNLASIPFEGESVADAVELVLVNHAYHDVLLTDDFRLEVPLDAQIRGISVEVRRSGDESAADDAVRIVKGGRVGTADRALPGVWSEDFTWVTYGGPDDLWGETWSAADVNAGDFGVGLAVAYTRTVGNTRAYVDQVRVTVHYSEGCGR